MSPPLSISVKSASGNSCVNSSIASKFIEGSSLTAVWGQAPVWTPRIRSGGRTPARVRLACSASSLVKMSLVTTKGFNPRLTSRGTIVSIKAVFPEPTGPPTPIRGITRVIAPGILTFGLTFTGLPPHIHLNICPTPVRLSAVSWQKTVHHPFRGSSPPSPTPAKKPASPTSGVPKSLRSDAPTMGASVAEWFGHRYG